MSEMETKVEHSPLPWHVDGDRIRSGGFCVAFTPGGLDNHVAYGPTTRANAEFIVRAVNSHADLVAALKALRDEVIASGNWDARDFNWPQVRALTESALAQAEQR